MSPDEDRSPYARGVAAHRSGHLRQAIDLLRQAIAADPTLARARHLLGLCHEELGEFEVAATRYREALRIEPRNARTLANLIALPTCEAEPALIDHARATLCLQELDPNARARLHHALGKHYDRQGSFDFAFMHFAASNAAQRLALPPFDRKALTASVDAIIAAFDAKLLHDLRDASDADARPIFVVGMPRSGTTLAEQILASHPEVFGAGELTAMPDIAREVLQQVPTSRRAIGSHAEGAATFVDRPGAWLDRHEALRLARRYLANLTARAPQGVARAVDKLPLNFAHLGLIAILFPQASIVHCRRDAMDVGLSCYVETLRQFSWATDLGDIGFFIAQKERLMGHWRRVLPLPIHELDYAALVSDQERETRALLEHCGLSWHPGCLDYFRTERRVNTPSRWQVRQPIYASSEGRWRRYRRHLDPLIDALPTALRTGT